MKSKIFSKKLILNKNTITDLNNKEMKEAAGAGPPPTEGTWCAGSCAPFINQESECYSHPVGHFCIV